MKSGFKIVLLIGLLFNLSNKLQAQRLFFVFAHGQYSVPASSTLSDDYNYGIGGEVGGGVGFKNTFVTGMIGHSSFNDKSGSAFGNLKYTPVRFGVRQYLFRRMLYANANGGFATVKNEAMKETKFTTSVGVGAKLLGLEVEAAYEGINISAPNGWAGWFGLKAGMVFGL